METAAHIEVKRYRYQKDKRTGKVASYTEYRFYVDYILKYKANRGEFNKGNLFMSIYGFKAYCRKTFNQAVIDVFKPEYINLSFEPQR